MAPRPNDPLFSALAKYTKGYQFKIESKEDPEVIQSRLRREESDAALKRRIEYAFALAVIITVSIVSAACLWITLVPGYPAASLDWASKTLTVIISGGVGAGAGYLTGKVTK
jgi:Flp pilus assembly pilin Flp